MMRIKANFGSGIVKGFQVRPDEPLYILGDILGIDQKAKFRFFDKIYTIGSDYTFREIGMSDNSRIFVKETAHICPYGCGRMIPCGYKGCTELLQERPNYFN